ncbi:polysaccharide export protein [Corticibacter populi]|uniref:Polysaccharide export protein n=1 Tax=Corticibacter populi TaxID=1550736 RepID=A0A3M6QKA7_9BURK|nr:polysaccharide biosynthesis/export family protein [Corticibacter populi]RMX03534.1 polysaccharide export protein [Corticibacter populi]RZS29985.1 polysaccharide biosynthesis/export protein [Corticibacter populi]
MPSCLRTLKLTLAMALPGMAALMAGCSTPATIALPDAQLLEQRHAQVHTLAELTAPVVRIHPGDTLRIVRDAQEPAESDDMTLFVVQPDGAFSMPFVGKVQAAGKTPEALAGDITERYARIYRQPQVTVNIAIAPGNKVFVGGAVPNPAFFDLAGAGSVEQAILASGGVLPTADTRNVALLREGDDGKYQLYFFSLANLLTEPDRPVIALQRGDVLYVPKSGIGNAVEAVDMYFTRLIPISKAIGLGFNYELNRSSSNSTINWPQQ